MRIDINGISKSELEKLRAMSRKNGYTSLNEYLQFLIRREIENDLVDSEKVTYKNYFVSMQKMLFSLSEGYVQSTRHKKEISEYFSKMLYLINEWLYLTDPSLKEFAEDREPNLEQETGIIFEKKLQKISEIEKNMTSSIDESHSTISSSLNEKLKKQLIQEKRELKIRGLSTDDIAGLKLLSKHAKAANLNQYMLDQVYLILKNGGLDIYDNRLADDALEVKNLLVKIADQQTRQELHDMEIISKLNVNIELMINWIKFMSLAQTDQL